MSEEKNGIVVAPCMGRDIRAQFRAATTLSPNISKRIRRRNDSVFFTSDVFFSTLRQKYNVGGRN